ncbi:YgiT-type zinc finger protein [candidate division TA06 bacterium]|uniref:YgiT-type zinc finger protein n=1 Tax=candidate division TA06 bacterium TaxID=2250710 RepID=A0A933I9T6_UNCT6|nr:YgiT-type zinc finger protein [candidate division TA06 bacterium]
MKERFMPREARWQGRLFIFENVPRGVCTQCGEKVLKPDIAKAIDRTFHEQRMPKKPSKFPSIRFALTPHSGAYPALRLRRSAKFPAGRL